MALTFQVLRRLSHQAVSMREHAVEEEARLQNLCVHQSVDFKKHLEMQKKIAIEVDSLRKRPRNLPSFFVDLRSRLADAVGLPVTELPFAGELLQVKVSEQRWEGALERVLHGLAVSLLVGNDHYPQVARWVNETHLNGRLV